MNEIVRVFDKYEVIRRIASGGMGDIFLAKQLGVAGFERLAILKALKPDLVANEQHLTQFLDEARTVARLNHPNIVAIFEVDEYRGVYFIAMEHIAGVDIGTLLRKAARVSQRIPFRVTAGIIHDAAMGLAHAHAAHDATGKPLDLVHRDISPQNVMIRGDGISKVLDFGVATVRGSPQTPGSVQGKIRYMAPEQAMGQSVWGAADQFSLGVVLWEMCTQRRLFTENTPKAIVTRIVRGQLQRAKEIQPDIPDALDEIAATMLSADPKARFSTMKQVVDALRKYLDATGGPADRAIEKYVAVMAGADIAALTKDLEPQPVAIAGLLPVASVACAQCGRTNQRKFRYCAFCGAQLGAVAVRPKEAPAPDVAVRRIDATQARGSVQAMLFEHASELKDMAARRAVTKGSDNALALLARPAPTLAEELGAVEERFAAIAASFEGGILSRDGGEIVLGFSSDDRVTAARRALRCAGELRELFERHASSTGVPGGVVFYLARASELATTDERLNHVRELSDVGASELYVSAELARDLASEARFTETDHAELRRLTRWSTSANERRTMFGRLTEVAELRRVLTTGGRHALLFVGDRGMGKTRLLEEAIVLAARRGFAVATLDATPGDTPRELLAQIAASIGNDLLAGSAEPALIAGLVRVAKDGPVLLVVDDLQALASDQRGTLERLYDAAVDTKLVLIGAARAGATAGLPRIFTAIELAPLADDKLLAVAQAHAEDLPLPGPAQQAILEHAHGNPLLAQLLVDAAIADGAIHLDGERWVASPRLAELDLSRPADTLMAERFAALAPELQRFFEIAAVSDLRFSVGEVLNALGLDVEVAEAAKESRLVVDAGDGAYRFDPPSHRASILRGMSADSLRAARERLGRSLLAGADDADVELRARAVGLLLAGDRTLDAIELGMQLGASMTSGPAALRLLRAATNALIERLASVAPIIIDDDARFAAAARRATLALAEHDTLEAQAALEVLQRAAHRLDPKTRAALLVASARIHLLNRQLSLAEADLTAAAEIDDAPGARAEITAARAEIAESRGELERATELLSESLRISEGEAVDPDFVWTQSNALGRLFLRMGAHDRADRLFTIALAQAEASGSVKGRVAALNNLASLLALKGRAPDAIAQLDRAITLARDARDALGLARAHQNRGRILVKLGRREDAKKALEESARLAHEIGWSEGEAMARQGLRGLR